jgi:hypothetical protein
LDLDHWHQTYLKSLSLEASQWMEMNTSDVQNAVMEDAMFEFRVAVALSMPYVSRSVVLGLRRIGLFS